MKKKILGIVICLSIIMSVVSSSFALSANGEITSLEDKTNTVINKYPADTGNVPAIKGNDNRPSAVNSLSNGIISKLTLSATSASGTLILYDTTKEYGWLGELYAIAAKNLSSHFGATTCKPVVNYTTGEIAKYKAVIYIGSTYDESIPVAFLDDVLSNTSTQIIWMNHNIWQLANRVSGTTGFKDKYGFKPWCYDTTTISSVEYKNKVLTRDPLNAGGIMNYEPGINTTKATVLATAKKSDGTTFPWAIRSSNLTYIGEIPFSYMGSNDRYLAFCDMLFDALSPNTAARHRALVRLEDVSPNTDPVNFKSIVDYLKSENVPFSIALVPVYKDPLGTYNNGVAETVKWNDRPEMKAAITYALGKGGSLVMHGYTHQLDSINNPYSGVTGDDFEFFRSHVDTATNNVIYDGAVNGDSSSWALNRITSGLSEIALAKFPTPKIFEYPHYAGSPTDSKAIKTKFSTVYHRGIYFSGGLGTTPENLGHMIGQFYPYKVTDIYGWNVLPESLGNYEPEAYNNHPARLATDIIDTADKNLVIRDGVASFYFHPYYPVSELTTIVKGIKSKGYTFVTADSL